VIVTDADGTEVARFSGQGWAISWSPDAKRVAVLDNWVHAQGEDVTIGVYASDGTRQMTLTVPSALATGSGDYSAAWSRDGSSIMLPGVRVPLDGGDPAPSKESGFFTGCCAYSPDGSVRGVVDEGTLVLEESDTPEDQKVGPLEFDKLAWSPDGSHVAFERITDIVEGNPTELIVRDVATGTDKPIVDAAPSGRLDVIEFTPDGDRILFMRAETAGGARSLWSIGVDGADARRLVDRIDWADLRPQN
jgi:Tol biopolymer transport system component